MIFYFDMDGVLTDFDVELKNRGWSRSDPDFEEKMTKEHNEGYFYSNLPKSHRFDDLKNMIQRLEKDHPVEFLSSLGGRPCGPLDRVYRQKKDWLESHGLSMRLKLVNKCWHKCQYAGDALVGGHFLIDDQLQNVKDWRKSGGLAFHYTPNFHDDLEFIIGSIT